MDNCIVVPLSLSLQLLPSLDFRSLIFSSRLVIMFSSLSLLPTVVLSLSLCSAVFADPHQARHHHALNRLPAVQNVTFTKRTDNARFSYYSAGLGACGQTNSDSDFVCKLLLPCNRGKANSNPMQIVALNSPVCFLSLLIPLASELT